MECPMCFELYSQERIARNLLCGHTYCQLCLDQIVVHKRRIECPMCRHKHDPQLKVTSLSRNYVAMDLASKHLEVARKLQLCTVHNKNPLQFFCEDCQLHLCTECIVEHSGHKFCKQEHSVSLLKERLTRFQEKLKSHLVIQEKQTMDFGSTKIKLNDEFNFQIKLIDSEFDKVISKIEERRNTLKELYKKEFDEQVQTVENELITNQQLLENMKNIDKKFYDAHEELGNLQVLKNNEMIKLLDSLEEEAEKDMRSQSQLKSSDFKQMPKLTFDQGIFAEINKYGAIARSKNFIQQQEDYQNPKLCFFGDKHKILIYDIDKEEWQYKQLPQPSNFEFNYYSASASLPNGEIIITGGGVSKATLLISPQKKFLCQPLQNMYFPRKEHAAIYLNGYVYAIGGYDGSQKQMLSSCERYSLETNEWKIIEPLQKAKCAFAAAAVNNDYIYVFGGFDGRERLNTIERYSHKENRWITIETRFKNGFSNAAAVGFQENKILILGGGSNQGFTLELQMFDTAVNSLKILSKMSEGRDLRNKLAYMNGYLYSCGGSNCSAEKYCTQSNKWIQLKYATNLIKISRNYNNYVSDNLDSWCCALTFDLPEGKMQQSILQQIAAKTSNYQIYEYFSDGLSEEIGDGDEYPDYDHDEYEDIEDINFNMGGLQGNLIGRRVFQL